MTLKTLKARFPAETPRKWLVLSLVLAVAAALPGLALAGVGDVTDIKPLAEIEYMPEKEFEAATQLIEATPYADEALAFKIRLPKDWKEEEPEPAIKAHDTLSKKILGELAHYVSPSRLELNSYFTLEALEQTYEVSARNWLINYLLHNGNTLSSLTEYSEREVEAMYVEIRKDITYAVRAKAFINGPRVIIARYYVPQDDFQNERTMQAQAMKSLSLPNHPPGGIEKWKSFGFLDQSYFDYPESWTLSAPQIRSIERMRAMLYTGKVEGQPDGQINVYLTSRLLGVPLQEEIKRQRANLTKIQGYKLGNRIEVIDTKFNKDISFGKIETYELNPDKVTMIKYELVFAVLQGEDYYYFVSLLTPSRTFDFYLWSRNMRAFRIVLETMRRYNTENDAYYQYLKN